MPLASVHVELNVLLRPHFLEDSIRQPVYMTSSCFENKIQSLRLHAKAVPKATFKIFAREPGGQLNRVASQHLDCNLAQLNQRKLFSDTRIFSCQSVVSICARISNGDAQQRARRRTGRKGTIYRSISDELRLCCPAFRDEFVWSWE